MKNKNNYGFTIIEVLIVVVIIVILSAVTALSYASFRKSAVATSLQSDLSKASDELKLYELDHNSYPHKNDCSANPEINTICLKSSSDNTLTYGSSDPYKSYVINASNGSNKYHITNDTTPTEGEVEIPVGIQTIKIGNQTWMQQNINSGTKIPATNVFTNESPSVQVPQRHCKANDDNYCNVYGGVYSWNEVFGYPVNGASVEGYQGICPDGFHVPSNADWTALKSELGGAGVAGGKMKEAGTSHWTIETGATNSSGFTALPAGSAYYENFSSFGTEAYFWSSTQYGTEALYWYIPVGSNGFGGGTIDYTVEKNNNALSVRCIKN
ncbi:MAG: FISUMP domain-containing protein [Candidatus Saccharibacteria bacterium]